MNGRIMRYWSRGLGIILLVLIFTGGLCAKARWQRVIPQEFDKKVTLRISEKNRIYFALQKDAQIQVRISGPTRLRVISRVQIPSSKDEYRYSYFVRKNEGKWIKYSQRAEVSTHTKLVGKSSAQISESKERIFKVPEGTHTYTFRLPKNSSRREFLRFHQREGDFGTPTDVVAMTPQIASESVDLIVREKVTTYYRLQKGNDVLLRLIGPATLKVLARLEFDPNMRGRQNFRVQVFENDLIKGTYSLTSEKSDVCQYKEMSSLVPSKGETFYVDIPQGEHEYRFVRPENHRSVLIKFLLPKKDLDGEL